jgi:hypothetical protein
MEIMYKTFNPEMSKNYYFLVNIVNPDKSDSVKGYPVVIYSYVNDIQIISAIVKHCTKYDFTITEVTKTSHDYLNQWSINQACGYLRRFRFIRRKKITLSKVVTWEEEIKEEL